MLRTFTIRQLAFCSMMLSTFVAFAAPNAFLLGARTIFANHNPELNEFLYIFGFHGAVKNLLV